MKGHMNTQMGEVLIDTDVIAKYAGSVAVECFGIVGMASVNMKDGLVKLLKKDSLTHGISVELNDNRITLDFHVTGDRVKYTFYCDAEFYVRMFGRSYPVVTQGIELTGYHNTKF